MLTPVGWAMGRGKRASGRGSSGVGYGGGARGPVGVAAVGSVHFV